MDDRNTGTSLDLVYDALSEDEQSTYRLIGLLPGPSFTAEMIAKIDAITQEEAQRRLTRLASAKLLAPTSAKRFTMHDRVRSHAQANARAVYATADLGDIARWIAEGYRDRAADAQRAVIPARWYLGDCFRRRIEKTFTKQDALDWLEAELPTLLAVQQMAYDEQLYPIVCDITESLWGLVVYRRTHSGWLRSCQIGYQAAVAWGDSMTQARMLEGFGAAYHGKQDWLTAETYFRRALVLEEQADHLEGAATALEGIGISQLGQGEHGQALGYFMRALGYHLALKHPRGARLQQRHIGQVHLAAGRHGAAIAAFEECRQYQHGPGEEYLEGRELLFEGQARIGVGDLDNAEQLLDRAFSIAQQNRTEHEEATISVALADLASARRDPGGELDRLRHAYDLFTRLRHPHAHQVRERIEAIRATGEE